MQDLKMLRANQRLLYQAGCKKAITIATNMAGRGTDILLGGNPTSLTNDLIKELFEDKDRFNNNEFIKSLKIEDPDFLENLRLNYKDLLKTSLSELEEKNRSDNGIIFTNL